jgi:hypothetical protein
MKIRTGFVSNSSSSSFVINKKNLDGEMIQKILDYEDASISDSLDDWSIHNGEDEISGFTVMDNGDFKDYLKKVGVVLRPEDIRWEDDMGGFEDTQFEDFDEEDA